MEGKERAARYAAPPDMPRRATRARPTNCATRPWCRGREARSAPVRSTSETQSARVALARLTTRRRRRPQPLNTAVPSAPSARSSQVADRLFFRLDARCRQRIDVCEAHIYSAEPHHLAESSCRAPQRRDTIKRDRALESLVLRCTTWTVSTGNRIADVGMRRIELPLGQFAEPVSHKQNSRSTIGEKAAPARFDHGMAAP